MRESNQHRPEFVPARWRRHILNNQTAPQITGALLFKRG
jgi:hypothetical protein